MLYVAYSGDCGGSVQHPVTACVRAADERDYHRDTAQYNTYMNARSVVGIEYFVLHVCKQVDTPAMIFRLMFRKMRRAQNAECYLPI